ncbi:claudin 10-like 2 isoform X2 [Danio rerio]|uniref:Claudin 10-like 2 isoform X2 n=1 Tax=Danio rerio TaxID=7955 RepID=A0AC58GE62_DANRE|nr:claudin-10-like [Danio rerio]|eukprot:XP_021334473.1 claudin-10-like [Danio rerio]
MHYRTLLMHTEMVCFVVCVCGWLLVCSTVPTECWAYSEVHTSVLTSAHYFSNLWKDCLSDSTGVTDCKVFPTFLALRPYIHVCRSFLFTSILLGLFGSILALVGMKCTKLGGSETVNAKVTFAGGINYLTSGLCGMFTYSWYGHRVVSEFMDPGFVGKRYELGPALFVGWGGSALLMLGGLVFSFTAGNQGFQSRTEKQPSPLSGDKQIILSSSSSSSSDKQKSSRAAYGLDAYV